MQLTIVPTVVRSIRCFAYAVAVTLLVSSACGAAEPGDSFWEQKDSVSTVTFSRDGKQLLTAGGSLRNGHVAVWNLDTMKRVARFSDVGMVTEMLVAPDGKTLFAHVIDHLGGRLTLSKVVILNAETGKAIAELAEPQKHLGFTSAMAVSSDGKRLAVGHVGGVVTIHDPVTGKVDATLSISTEPVWSVAFSADGKTLAIGGPQGARLWDLTKGKEIATVPVGRYSVGALAFSPDGKTLIAGTGRDYDTPGELVVWDVAAGKIRARWKGHRGPVVSVHFSGDGKFVASGARSSDIKLWDAVSGKELLDLDGPLNLSRVAFAPDGKALAVSGGTGDFIINSGGVRLWDLPSGRERLHPKAAAERDRREAAIQRTAADQAKVRTAGGPDQTGRVRRAEYALKVHLAADATERWRFAQARQLLDELKPAPGQSDIRGIEWHLLDARVPRFTEIGDNEPAHHAAFSPDGTQVAVSTDSTLRVLAVSTGETLFTCKGFRHHPGCTVCSPDGKWIAVSDYTPNADISDVRIISAGTGKDVATLVGHRDGVETIAFSPDGRQLATGGRGSRVFLWETKDWKQTQEIEREWIIAKVAFSPDGKRLAMTPWFHGLRIRDLESGKDLFQPGEQHQELGADGMVFLPDGKHLLAGNRDGWALVEVATGNVVRRMSGTGTREPALVSQGKQLLAGWSLLDVSSGKEVAVFEDDSIPGRRPRRGYELLARSVTPDGQVRMVVADEDHTWLARFDLGDGRRELPTRASLSEIGFSADCSTLLALTQRGITKHDPEFGGAVVGHASFVERWDASTGKVKFQPRWFDPPGIKLAFDPEPKATAGFHQFSLADIAAIRPYVSVPTTKEETKVLGISPNGRVLALLEEENSITIRDSRTGKVRATISIQDSWDANVLFTSDGAGMVTWKGDLVLWDTKTSTERKRWAVPGYIRGVRLTPDGKEPAAVVYAARRSNDVILWDVRRGEQIALLRGCSGYVDAAVFSPDGQTLATSGASVRLWDAVSGHPRGVLRVPSNRVGYLTFRPDGRALAASGYGEPISLWAVPPR